MKRKEILFKKIKLSKEIDELNKIRKSDSNSEKTNELIKQKRKKHEFYNNLLKNM